jgi:hypothetical protein
MGNRSNRVASQMAKKESVFHFSKSTAPSLLAASHKLLKEFWLLVDWILKAVMRKLTGIDILNSTAFLKLAQWINKHL